MPYDGPYNVIHFNWSSEIRAPKSAILGTEWWASFRPLGGDRGSTIYLMSDTILFEQISFDITRSQFASYTKMNSNEFTKTWRIIISDSFCISKSFHSRICFSSIFKLMLNKNLIDQSKARFYFWKSTWDNLIFKGTLKSISSITRSTILIRFVGKGCNDGEITNDLFGIHSLTSTRFT